MMMIIWVLLVVIDMKIMCDNDNMSFIGGNGYDKCDDDNMNFIGGNGYDNVW